MTFETLRKKYPKFIFESFEIVETNQGLKVYFHFVVDPDIKFRAEISLNGIFKDQTKQIGEEVFENLIFNLGMVELISYWKATCSPEIIIKAGYLNTDQITWWKDLIVKGLGEFYYKNDVDFTKPDFISLTVETNEKAGLVYDDEIQDRSLVMVGGGKDSAVTLGIFQAAKLKFDCFSLAPTEAARAMSAENCSSPIFFSRTIDPKLLELNKQGYLNGHTPISVYYAFSAIVAAALYGYREIVVSNESSANEGNVMFHGQEINHQISKTFEFEKKIHNYFKDYLVKNIGYVSFLRPLNELQITALFAEYPKFHKVFRSCNFGSKQGVWCLSCAKCCFVYLMLFPFLGSATKDIFGKDLLEDDSLLSIFESLGQVDQLKPFECVGTKQEISAAVYLGIKKAKKIGISVPKILSLLEKKLLDHAVNYEKPVEELISYWNNENLLVASYQQLLKEKVRGLKYEIE